MLNTELNVFSKSTQSVWDRIFTPERGNDENQQFHSGEQSMKNILLMAVALFMLGASLISRAGGGTTNEFVGLWEAVDPEDGSHLILSITNNNDGTVKLLVYDTFWSRCNGSSRGIAQGTGEISAEQALKVDDYTVTCFETGDTVKVPITLTRNSDGTLSRTGAAPLAPLIIYHQTSK